MLIEPTALQSRLGEAGLGVLDVRTGEAFAMGHLPGASHYSVYGINIYDTDPAPLASFARMWAFQLGLRGLAAEDNVVVYDDTTGMSAARAFWFLEYLGHKGEVLVLDGGLDAWAAAGLPLERDAAAPTAGSYKYSVVPERVATWRQVQAAIGAPGAVLLDTRGDPEWTGAQCTTARCGTIPTAVHLEWVQHVTADGRMRPPAELRELFAAHGVTPDKDVIAF
jgi:thiosulfate/3-mercaptopyruvate sulfurtransferase